jgi:glycosyltransferase involved in cell wall biosynthesis
MSAQDQLPSSPPGSRGDGTLSIVIPVKNDARRLARCLASIAASPAPSTRVEVVVCDNGSSDESPEVARQAGAHVLVLPGLKVGQLRNEGARQATGDLIAFVDADHAVGPGWTAAALDVLKAPEVGMTGAEYLPAPGPTWVQRLYDAFREHRAGRFETEWLGSGNMILRRALFDRLGGFDTTLEACEDVDLCRRVRGSDYKIVADAGIESTHYGDPPTLKKLFLSELWRGRDNLRVSLRPPRTARSLFTALVPVVDLIGILVIAAGLVAWPWGGGWAAAAALVICTPPTALRAVRLYAGIRDRRVGDAGRAITIAIVYDLARALALALQAGHHRK